VVKEFAYTGSELELFARAVRWKRYVGSVVGPFLGRRVVEVGAGQGATAEVLCDGGQELWLCLEPDPSLAARIEEARGLGRVPGCCQVRKGTSENLSTDDRLDTALYVDVLEHIADDREELRRASAVLVRGGHLIVVSPAHPALYSAFDAAIGHFRRYTRKSLVETAPPELRLVRLAALDAVGSLASLGNKLFLRQTLPTPQQIAVWDSCMVPLSRLLDPLLRWRLGRSLLAVWKVV
jgi:hypothetical protein